MSSKRFFLGALSAAVIFFGAETVFSMELIATQESPLAGRLAFLGGCAWCYLNMITWSALFRYATLPSTKTADRRNNLLVFLSIKALLLGVLFWIVFSASKIVLKSALLGFTASLIFGSLFTALAQKNERSDFH